MFGIPAAITAIANLFNKGIDANNNEKNFDLKDRKKINKAMDAAEHHIFAVDSFFNKSISAKQLEFLHKKFRKIFFDNN